MIEVSALSSTRGDTTMYVEDSKPEDRAKLAETVTRLLKEGHTIFIVCGDELTNRITGYDAATNEWLCETGKKGKSSLFSWIKAAATKAVRVPRSAGG